MRFFAPMQNVVIQGVSFLAGLSSVRSGESIPAPCNLVVGERLYVPSGLVPSLRSGVELQLSSNDVVAGGVDVLYSLLPYTLLYAQLPVPSPMLDETVIVNDGTYLLPDPTGAKPGGIPILKAEVEAVEDNYGWVGSFTLEDAADLVKFTPSTVFFFHLGADVYKLVVDGRSYSATEHTGRVATVKGISPAVLLTSPRSSKVTKTWDSPMMSHAIIQEMVDGFPVDIQIDILNWAIPANRFGVDGVDRLSVIRQVVEAVGGVLDSLHDGTLRARPRYSPSVPLWGGPYVNHVYSGDSDVFLHIDNDEPVKVYDKFRVMDAQALEGGDKMEYTELGVGRGEMRVYPSPYRTSCYLDSSSYSVVIGTATEEYRTEKEIIEIYNAEGTTKYPVSSVVSLRWMDFDLSGVVAGNDSTKVTTTHATLLYSLVEIEYRTRCLLYPVTGIVGSHVQFLLRNL